MSDLNFGDYVTIEQFRYYAENEIYQYKVIQSLNSNGYVDVPVTGFAKESGHDKVVPCVRCICCGVVEDRVLKFRVEDVKKLNKKIFQS